MDSICPSFSIPKRASCGFEITICFALPVLWLQTWLDKRNILTGTLFVWDVNGKDSWPKSYIRRLAFQRVFDLPEVTKSQQVIEDYQIIVLSAEHFNAIVFEGPKREKQIYLNLCNNHYDVITSVSSFLGRSHWCLACKKGFDRKEGHR